MAATSSQNAPNSVSLQQLPLPQLEQLKTQIEDVSVLQQYFKSYMLLGFQMVIWSLG